MSAAVPARMRAARMHRFGGPLELVEVPVPEPGPGEVLLRVRAAGICATDLKLRAGETKPAPSLPHIPGHEVAGEVVAGDTELPVGTRAACYLLYSCGHCEECERGLPVLCAEATRLGLDRDGGMAEYVRLPAAHVLPIGDDVPFEAAAVSMDSVLTPWFALHRTGELRAGEAALIVGVGGLGGNAVQLAVAAGARVAAVDVDRGRLDAALAAGAELAVTPEEIERVLEWSGVGVDLALEVSGRPQGFDAAARVIRAGGRIVCCGYAPGRPYGMDSARLVLDNVRILGSRNASLDSARAALGAVAAGQVKPRIADVLPLASVNEALDRLAAGGADGRLVLDPLDRTTRSAP
jgi:propanol-preferring alcohol dehydrogenase